jgi:hypothetical protein
MDLPQGLIRSVRVRDELTPEPYKHAGNDRAEHAAGCGTCDACAAVSVRGPRRRRCVFKDVAIIRHRFPMVIFTGGARQRSGGLGQYSGASPSGAAPAAAAPLPPSLQPRRARQARRAPRVPAAGAGQDTPATGGRASGCERSGAGEPRGAVPVVALRVAGIARRLPYYSGPRTSAGLSAVGGLEVATR